jgi:hypothetical protein
MLSAEMAQKQTNTRLFNPEPEKQHGAKKQQIASIDMFSIIMPILHRFDIPFSNTWL